MLSIGRVINSLQTSSRVSDQTTSCMNLPIPSNWPSGLTSLQARTSCIAFVDSTLEPWCSSRFSQFDVGFIPLEQNPKEFRLIFFDSCRPDWLTRSHVAPLSGEQLSNSENNVFQTTMIFHLYNDLNGEVLNEIRRSTG